MGGGGEGEGELYMNNPYVKGKDILCLSNFSESGSYRLITLLLIWASLKHPICTNMNRVTQLLQNKPIRAFLHGKVFALGFPIFLFKVSLFLIHYKAPSRLLEGNQDDLLVGD